MNTSPNHILDTIIYEVNSINEKKFIHTYNEFYKISLPFLNQVRNFEKTVLLKMICKLTELPVEIENAILNYCF